MKTSARAWRPAIKEAKKQTAERRHRDQLLDQALADTFPASDALAILEPAPELEDEHEQ